MNTITFTQENSNTAEAQEIIDGVLRLRHETFIERLEWDIPSTGGKERDNFDNYSPYHIASVDENKSVNGCWRALRTTNDYMLKDVFPQLLQGEAAPEDVNIWEISRFAVKKGSAEVGKGYMGDITLDLVKSFYDFAQEHNIKAYVTVTTVACERLLRQLGVNLRRMGDGKALQIGIERSVALWIEVDEKLCIVKH